MFVPRWPTFFLVFLLGVNRIPAAEDSIAVTVLGTLRTGLVAIGGETTGTTITAKGITWELDFGKNKALRSAAQKLHASKVRVKGTRARRKGVEIKERWIVTVSHLQPANEAGAGGKENPGLRATGGRPDSRIRISGTAVRKVVTITSNTGIGSATLTRASEPWPETMLVRLHLRGLESFRVSANELVVEWAVSSTRKKECTVSLRKDGIETALGKDSPFFAEVRVAGGGGKIPLEEGHFEIALPEKLFEANPDHITMKWIDFYRD